MIFFVSFDEYLLLKLDSVHWTKIRIEWKHKFHIQVKLSRLAYVPRARLRTYL